MLTVHCPHAIHIITNYRDSFYSKLKSSVYYKCVISMVKIMIVVIVLKAKKLRALPNKEKRAISDLLDTIEDVLPKHWSKYPGYQQLQNNIEKVRDALADNGDQKNHGKY